MRLELGPIIRRSSTIWPALAVLLLLAGACRAADPWAPPACDGAGHSEQVRIEETRRGYAYHFVVYMPPCYEEQSERRYPVLFLFPGRGSGPGAWFDAGVDDLVEALIQAGELPPMLVFGVARVFDDPEMTDFLGEMLPYAEANYRLLDDPLYRAVAGGSLGVVASYRLALRYPQDFGSAGLFGGGALSGEEETIRAWLAALPPDAKTRLFLNTGLQDSTMLSDAQRMMALLDEYDIEYSEVGTAGGHDYGYWLSNFRDYFEWLAGAWH